MARKIICDRCGRECTGTHGTLELNRTQSTAQNEPVGYDHFEIMDLCDICTEIARTEFGFRIADHGIKEIEQLSWGDAQPMLRPHDIGHYSDEDPPPARLAVGMMVTRAIAARWNAQPELPEPEPAEQ